MADLILALGFEVSEMNRSLAGVAAFYLFYCKCVSA